MRSSSLMVSGGRNRSTLPNVPQDNTITPAAWHPAHSALVRLGVGFGGAGLDQLHGDHRAAATHVADAVVVGLQPAQPVLHQLFDLRARAPPARRSRSFRWSASAAAQATGLPP